MIPPDPPLHDGVVTLRPWGERDVEQLVELLDGDAEVTRWLTTLPQPYRSHDARMFVGEARRRWRERSGAAFAIECDGAVVGSIDVQQSLAHPGTAEVGYWLAAAARGQGLTARALRLVGRWALAGPVERLQLKADVRNVASQRVAEKAGFVREGVLRSYRPDVRHGGRVDFVMFSLLPGELD